MRNTVLIVSGALLLYGMYETFQYKSSGAVMPDDKKTLAGAAMLIGLGGLGFGYIGLKK